MNQILYNKKTNRKLKYIFKVQFIISILIAMFLIALLMIDYSEDENLENISKVVNKNMGISSIYQASKISNTSNYLGKIYIEKIDLEYTVFNRFNKDLLKIAPCKFNGVNLGEKGNICIAGHNYNDNRFFSRLDELEIGDKVKLVSMQNEEFEYTIYKIFETDENDTSILKSYKNYELTLLTCNNSNKKRIIIKAYIKENTKP